MNTVFVVQHLHVLPGGEEDVKMIGVYKNLTDAEAAVDWLKRQPGFALAPNIVDPGGEDIEGFYVGEYVLGEDHWTEGFVTV